MRQMWFGGSLILLVCLSYLGWLAVRSSIGMPPEKYEFVHDRSMPTPSPSVTGVILRLHGANTVGFQLAPPLAKAFLLAQGAKKVTIVGTGMDELAVMGELSGKRRVIEIKSHGSASAFSDLETGDCDIGMSARKINSSEAEDLSPLGDMTSPAAEHVLALDGIAVIVNRKNPLSQLSRENVARIFSGEVMDWSQVGGMPGRIKLYGRDVMSGTFETFKTLVLGGKLLSMAATRIDNGRELSAQVSRDPDGIGFVALPYVLDAKAVAISDSGNKALLPTAFTISTGDYLLSRRLYLYTAPRIANSLARRFVDFALGKAGQMVVMDAGFIPGSHEQKPASATARL